MRPRNDSPAAMAGDFLPLHPRGIHHGPHPKALKSQGAKQMTDECAVMLDAENPVRILPAAEAAEWKEYWESWMEA